ncbi:recombinase [Acinetobacter phage Ab69]|nr:recombinase [Acinetobacter phage Ab69]
MQCVKRLSLSCLSQNMPMSVELQQAISRFDQAVINEDGEASYVDNDQENENDGGSIEHEDQFPQFVAY